MCYDPLFGDLYLKDEIARQLTEREETVPTDRLAATAEPSTDDQTDETDLEGAEVLTGPAK